MSPQDDQRRSRKLRRWLIGASALVLGVIVVVVAVVLISSSGDDMAANGMAPPSDGNCGNALSGDRAQDTVLVSGSVNCETAVRVINGHR